MTSLGSGCLEGAFTVFLRRGWEGSFEVTDWSEPC